MIGKPSGAMGATEWLLLVLLSGLWGGSFFFYKVLVAALPPVTAVLGRVAVAALALNLALLARGEALPRDGLTWRRFLAMGLLNNAVPFTLIAWGEIRIASGLASILNATTPLFGVVAAHWLTADERLTPARGLGVLFGLAGAVVLVGPAVGDLAGDLPAEAACLAAAGVYALAGIYGRRFRGSPPLTVAAGQVTASTALLLPVALLADRPWTLPLPASGAWAALAGLALASTALAYIVYFRILAAAGATNLLLVTFLLPVSALLLGHLALGEPVTGRALAGMALIGLGLAAIDGRPWRWLARAGGGRSRARTG